MSLACASRRLHVLAGLGRGYQPHPRADLDRERQRVGEMQPGFPLRERHHVGEPGERQERDPGRPGRVLQAEQVAAVVHLAFHQRLDLTRTPDTAFGRRRQRLPQRAAQRVLEQPGDLDRGRVPGSQRARAKRPAEPLGLFGPLADLGRRHRLVVQAHGPLTSLVDVDELGQHSSRQLGSHTALAQPDAEVDLLLPEVLSPDVPVHLVQVIQPARPAVGGGIQAGRPFRGRVGAVRDPQVHLGLGHPDRGHRHRDVGGQRLPLGGRDELIRHRRQPEVRPGVGLRQQDPVVEVPDTDPAAPPARPGPPAHR